MHKSSGFGIRQSGYLNNSSETKNLFDTQFLNICFGFLIDNLTTVVTSNFVFLTRRVEVIFGYTEFGYWLLDGSLSPSRL